MMLQLDQEWTKKLLSQPESGMGYQLVDVTLRSGKRLPRLTVLNGEQLALPESLILNPSDILRIDLHT